MKLRHSFSKLATLMGVIGTITATSMGNVRASTLDYPQSVPSFQYVTKNVLIGNHEETIHGIVVANDQGYYVEGADLQQLLAYYLVQSQDVDPGSPSGVGLNPNTFDFYTLGGNPNLPAKPFQENLPLPPYAYQCSLYVNQKLVGYAATLEINDGKISSDTDTIYVRVSDLIPLLQTLGIGNQWTNTSWNLQAPKSPVSLDAAPSSLFYLSYWSGLVGLSRSYLTPSALMDGPARMSNLLISPDGETAYASSRPFGNIIYAFNLSTGTFKREIDPSFQPAAAAMTPNGKTLILMDYWTGVIQSCTVQTGTLSPKISLGNGENLLGLGVSPDGKIAYLAALSGKSTYPYGLYPLNLAAGTFGKVIPVQVGGLLQLQRQFQISPDGKTAYLLEGNVKSGSLLPVNLKTGVLGRSIPLGVGPADFSLSPNGRMAYVLGYDNSVTPVNLVRRAAGQPVILIKTTGQFVSNKAIRVSPDGNSAYVFTGSSVFSLNLNTMAVESAKPVFSSDPSSPSGFAIAPDQPPVAAFSATVQGMTVTLNASASKSSSEIISYAWNFDDGSRVVTKSPIVKHTYHARGNYKVTLIETDAAGATVNNAMIYTGQMALVNVGSPSAEISHRVQIR